MRNVGRNAALFFLVPMAAACSARQLERTGSSPPAEPYQGRHRRPPHPRRPRPDPRWAGASWRSGRKVSLWQHANSGPC